jgi:hypothetical protein
MSKQEIIARLQAICNEESHGLTSEQRDAIEQACRLISKAEMQAQWMEVLYKLSPLLDALLNKM